MARVATRRAGDALTPSEIRVLELAGEGKTSKETAAELSRSIETVNTHRRHVLEKLEANNIAHAFAIAFRNGDVE